MTLFDSVEHSLVLVPVDKVRLDSPSLGHRGERVGDKVNKRMFIPDDMSDGPVVARVGVCPIGCLNHPEALDVGRIFFAVILKLVHPLKIEDDRSL